MNMATSSFRTAVLLFVFILTATVGCGDGRPKRVPVSGQVLIDGKPLQHGVVRFVSPSDRPSGGLLDKDGHFSLTCYEPGDGAVLGKHQIAVSADERLSESRVHWHAPKKYADYQNSGLTQEIKGPTDSIKIDLTWAGGKPFDEVDDSQEYEPKGKR